MPQQREQVKNITNNNIKHGIENEYLIMFAVLFLVTNLIWAIFTYNVIDSKSIRSISVNSNTCYPVATTSNTVQYQCR